MNIGYGTNDWSVALKDAAGHPTLGGAGHARVGIPARALEARGHNVYIGYPIGNAAKNQLGVKLWTGRAVGGFDVLVLQRAMSGELADVLPAAVQAGQVVVNDVDDYWWGLDRRNRAYLGTDPSVQPIHNRAHYARVLRNSTAVTTSTPYLADRLREMGVGRVEVIRNALDLPRWRTHDVTREPATIGWVGATPWRSGDLETLRGMIGPFLKKHGLRFHHGGYMPNEPAAAELLGIEGETTVSPVASVQLYPALWRPLDIGLVPLSLQPFNLAKSGIKGMEAAASGVPFVAAATPEYEWLERRGIGATARRQRDWVRHLTDLLDPDVRAVRAKVQRQALEPLGIETQVLQWEAFFESLLT